MSRFRCDASSITTVDVAGPDLVALRTGKMKGDTLFVRTEAKSVRKSLACVREFARVTSVQAHAIDLSDLILHHLDQQSFVRHEHGRRRKGSHPVFRTE